MGMKHLEMFERSRYTSDLDRLIYNSKVTLRELSSVGAVQALSKRLLIPIYTLLNEIKLNKKKKKMKGARGKSTAQVIKSSKLEAIAGMDPSEESLDNMRRALKEMKFQEGSTLYSAPFQQVSLPVSFSAPKYCTEESWNTPGCDLLRVVCFDQRRVAVVH